MLENPKRRVVGAGSEGLSAPFLLAAAAARVGRPDYVEQVTAAHHAMWRLKREEEQERWRKGWARVQGRPVLHRKR